MHQTITAPLPLTILPRVVDLRSRTVSDNTLIDKSYTESFEDHEAELLSRALTATPLSEDGKIVLHGRELTTISCP